MMLERAPLTSERAHAGPSTYIKLRIWLIYQRAPKAVPWVRSKLDKRRRDMESGAERLRQLYSTTNPATKDVGPERLG